MHGAARLLAILLGLAAAACFAQVRPGRVLGPAVPEAVPGEVLVKFYEGVTSYQLARFEARFGGVLTPSKAGMGVMKLHVNPKTNVFALAGWLRSDPAVEYAEPNGIVYIAYPNDEYYGDQWSLPKIRWPEAMNAYQGRSNVVIAILDTGVDLDHPDLVNKLVPGYDCVNEDDVPDDDNHHGTHVAGIAAAETDNLIGIAGVAPNARIMPVKVLGAGGGGSWEDVAQGVNYAWENGAHVLNMSFGGSSGSIVAQNAIQSASSHGCVMAAAAGNLNSSDPFYPAYYSYCIAVAGSNQGDGRLAGSNFNSGENQWVDVAAPGGPIFSTWNDGDYRNDSGTSMASPHVAGAAALLYSLVTEPDPNVPRSVLAAYTVRNLIEDTAVNVGAWVTHGRIDLGAAVEAGLKSAISGNLDLSPHVAPETVPITAELYEPGTGTMVASVGFNTDASGNYTITFDYAGDYDVRFKTGAPFLARRVAGVSLSRLSAASGVDAKLLSGDVDGNGVINMVDINKVLLDFGLAGSPYDANGDGVVNLNDLVPILLSYGLSEDQ